MLGTLGQADEARAAPASRSTTRAPSSRWSALAEKARRDGLLALEDDLAELDDTYTQEGASSSSSTAPTPTSSARSCSRRSTAWPRATRTNAALLRRPPAASPRPSGSSARCSASCTCSRTSSNPGSLGHSIAGAFIATLYGVGSANLIFLPIANKLKELSARRARVPRDAARGDPLDPGRRQPAHARARSSRRSSRPPSAAREASKKAAEGCRPAAERRA